MRCGVRVGWMLALAVAGASGCAHWPQGAAGVAGTVDARVARAFDALLGAAPAERRAEPAQRLAAQPRQARAPQRTPTPIPDKVAPASWDDGPTDGELLLGELPAPASPERQPGPWSESPPPRAPSASGPPVPAAMPVGDVCCDACARHSSPCPVGLACGRCAGCLAGGCCGKLFSKPAPGPPAVRYRPPMPPKFLPPPAQPTLSPAPPGAPEPWRAPVPGRVRGGSVIGR
mgnify:CR=1 FL=1